MRLTGLLFTLSLLLCASAATAQNRHAQVDLLTDVATIKPGETFNAGALFDIDPGWHIYWKNPGPAGIATRLKWTLPKGVTAGATQFPVPKKFVQPGDIVGYGYEKQAMLITPINVPADFAGKEVVLRVEISWLCCAEVCVPGKAIMQIIVPVAQKTQPANKSLFNRWARQIPAAEGFSDEYVDRITIRSELLDGNVRAVKVLVKWKRPPAEVSYYPGADKALSVDEPAIKTEDRVTIIETTIRPLAGQKIWPEKLAGVMGYQTDAGETRGVIVSLPAPPTSVKAESGDKKLFE